MIHVTITGADDSVGVVSVGHMAARYPWVEWGILISAKRMGSPRYPSAKWLSHIVRMQLNLSAHLCGSIARDPAHGAIVVALGAFQRVQVNGYELGTARAWADALKGHAHLILQARSFDDLGIVLGDAREAGADVLFDPSGGQGKEVVRWPDSEAPVNGMLGFAGGIKPENVERVCEDVSKTRAHTDRNVWIDMESGVRTVDDRLDWGRVTAVLDTVAAFNERLWR